MSEPVIARFAPLTLPTYPVGTPEENPVFFERRVYQGSCGTVYPVPFIDRVGDVPRARPVSGGAPARPKLACPFWRCGFARCPCLPLPCHLLGDTR